MRSTLCFAALLLLSPQAFAQFDVEESHVTTSLRGIDTAGPGVAWASGSGGTILRTEDGGLLWQPCTTPKGAEKLDFRGIQALDHNTAVVMSSGTGDLSRVYKTTDGCQTWKLVFTSPDPEGFFDTIRRVDAKQFYILGDPVDGRFTLFLSADAGETWVKSKARGLEAEKGDGAFAASNSSLITLGSALYFGTGGTGLPHIYTSQKTCPASALQADASCPITWNKTSVPLAAHTAASGVFALSGRAAAAAGKPPVLIAVGGTYDRPDERNGSSATSPDGGQTWSAAATPPGGYRSAVAYDPATRTWVAVGTNGADFSRDDGRTWHPIAHTPDDSPEVARGWNAIALPYVVGGKGRIGKLRPEAIKRQILPVESSEHFR